MLILYKNLCIDSPNILKDRPLSVTLTAIGDTSNCDAGISPTAPVFSIPLKILKSRD